MGYCALCISFIVTCLTYSSLLCSPSRLLSLVILLKSCETCEFSRMLITWCSKFLISCCRLCLHEDISDLIFLVLRSSKALSLISYGDKSCESSLPTRAVNVLESLSKGTSLRNAEFDIFSSKCDDFFTLETKACSSSNSSDKFSSKSSSLFIFTNYYE
ncbi:unnamed protein product [Moneuplotes crassus]|uniref:Uncharacterized protein n=1 Tax=Euplotes crassus TaxID=5936 RepID=A0AAD1UGM9_EUPCR|nr:unnamed protein product [Moneuplotes crassus]